MMKVECYEVKSARCGSDYFNGGRGSAMEFDYECFATEEEANKACARKRKKTEKNMAWCAWWIEKYIKDENFTVTKTVKKF